ncbi:hypothetical protein EGW08_007602 [Elysia chlorotica]|uniref:Sodium/glucose cotransporter 4 n=1 Tax=Elysia chlorotica TaxID=188477 RepID=A0A3S1C6Y2_ELYCH|nr:hypothetical protein EGW08_007602 [Elysia chlorotica]
MLDSTPGIDHWADITVISVYFLAVLAVGVWVGASLFSSNIGSEHFVGLAGTGAAAGIAMVVYEWSSMFLVICLAWVFLPVYVSSGVYTLPEYTAKRFGGNRLRIYLSCLSLILYIVTKLAVSIYAGALFINLALGWDMYLSIAGLLCITGFYTILGGLAAVIYTDTLQTVIMTIGAVILAVISFDKIGGYNQLQHRYAVATPSVYNNKSADCGKPRDDAFHIFRDPVNSDNPWPGLLFQSSLGCLWYWCCDQVIVQRSLAAKNLSHAKAGSILAGYLKLTPLFFMVFPGMISRALYPDMIACVDPDTCEKYCENRVGCSNVAYPKLVLELMPVYTLPEYTAKRFGGNRLRIYLSCLSLILYIVTKLAVSIYAGALFINLALGWDMYLSIAGLLCITGFYTILGGLAAVIYTDTLQTVIMTIGAVILAVISFDKIGGYNQLQHRYAVATPSVYNNKSADCGKPRDDAFHIFRDPVNSDNPWPGLLFQSSLGCLWYWCCDQVIVQRSLAAKNLSHAKAGSILAGYLKLTPLFFMVFPGMISRALYPDMIACVDPDTCEKYCENRVGCSNVAYPKLVLELMPVGLRGLLMAVMLSAIMSSLTSIFNSASTLFTMDLWRRMRTSASERELLIVGRLFVLLMCGVAILWIPMVRSSQGGQLFNYIQAVQGYLGTPIGALFIMAIFWKRMNEAGAFYGILTGHICGVARMAIDFAFPAPGCDEKDTRPVILSAVHYTYFGSISMLVTAAAIIIFSYTARAQEERELYGVTWWTRVDKMKKEEEESMEDGMDMKAVNGHSREAPAVKPEDNSYDSDENGQGCFDKLCGIPESGSDSQLDSAPDITISQRREFLHEDSRWKTILNINAAIGLAVMAFLIGYYK